MIIKLVTVLSNAVEQAAQVKKSGMKCIDIEGLETIVKSDTNEYVDQFVRLTFKGSILQALKADRILEKMKAKEI